MTTRTTTRRRLMGGGAAALLLGAGGAAALALPLLPGLRRLVVQQVIYRYVPGITFDGEDLARFTEHVERMVLNRHQIGLRGLVRYGGATLLHDWPLGRDLVGPAATAREIDRRIVNAFFRATDFWDAPSTPGRRIAMVRSPDPYEARCSNPLAAVA